MISRIWFGSTTFEKADDYVQHLQEAVFPELNEIEGFKGAYILRRDQINSVKFGVLTLWESMDSIKKFAGENTEMAVVPSEAQALLSEFDPKVSHYEVVAGPDI